MGCLDLPYRPARFSGLCYVPIYSFWRRTMFLFLKCHQYFLLLFVCPTILLDTCTGQCCVCRQFSILEKLFGLLFWKNNYTVSSTDINTSYILQQRRVRRDLFELNSSHKRLFSFFQHSKRIIVPK